MLMNQSETPTGTGGGVKTKDFVDISMRLLCCDIRAGCLSARGDLIPIYVFSTSHSPPIDQVEQGGQV